MNSITIRNGKEKLSAWRNPHSTIFKIILTHNGWPDTFRAQRPRYTQDYVWKLGRRWDRLHTARRAYLAARASALDELYAEYDDYRAHQSDGLPL